MMYFQPATCPKTGEFQYKTIGDILVLLGGKSFYSLISRSHGQKEFKDFIQEFIYNNKLKSNYIFVFFYNPDTPDLKYGNVEFWAFTYETLLFSSRVKIEKEESRVAISEVGELFNKVKKWLADSSSIEGEIVDNIDNIEESFKQFMRINSNNPNDILS